MKKIAVALRALFALAALVTAFVLSGCGMAESMGIYKPAPRLGDMSAHVDRESSTVQCYFTHGSVPTKLAVYCRNTVGDKDYLDIQVQLVEAIDKRGHAVFVVGHRTGNGYQALDMSKVYFILLEVRSSTWDYSRYNNYTHGNWYSGEYDFSATEALSDSPATKMWRDDPNSGITEIN